MLFKFTTLEVLHQDMKRLNKGRTTFPFVYNKKSFSCIFLADITPMRLYLTTLGDSPITFELLIYNNYCTDTYIDDYKELIKYLEIKYDPNHIFKPTDFFEVLNKRIPTKFCGAPSYGDVIRIVSTRRDVEDADRVYFCGWKNNPDGYHVRAKNLEKTRSAFGDRIANMCRDKNVSSRWTDIANEEDLAKLNEIYTFNNRA